ncbi:hypothetical protein GCM10022281_01700 [Sphingomonas rosea]|jgi:Flp pilus assembly protein TadG|uniref:TadE-like domain-containing protein n=1 Tax=Sphingomonas rosea TaxID=335605 RepID=A0ABP7TI74_9SPHN
MIGRLRHFLRDEGGAAVVELALCTTMFSVMIAGVADMSSAYSRKLALEQAVQRALEKQMQTTADDLPEATIKSEAVLQAGGGLTEDQVTVTRTRYCNGVAQSTYAGGCGTQTRTRYLNVKVYDDYSPILPAIKFGPVTSDGKYRVGAEAGVRIE